MLDKVFGAMFALPSGFSRSVVEPSNELYGSSSQEMVMVKLCVIQRESANPLYSDGEQFQTVTQKTQDNGRMPGIHMARECNGFTT